MNEERDKRLPASLLSLLIYQWILVSVSLCYALMVVANFINNGGFSDYIVFGLCMLFALVSASWVTAMAYASVGMTRRSPRGFLVGMICHLIVTILSVVGFIGIGSVGVLSAFSSTNEARGFAPLFLLFALMWLPTMLVSGWGFFYLRRLRKSLSP
jgi:hypothetical protein